jgi:hypothetical protein
LSPALLHLLRLSVRGRLRRLARQLRQPRYLLGFAIAVGWILFWLGNWSRGGGVREILFLRAREDLSGDPTTLIQLLVSLFLALGMSLSWSVPFGRLGLPLKESELQILLPAPVSRRHLVQYALLKSQLPVLLTALVFSFVFGSGQTGDQLRAFVGMWLLFTAIDWQGRLRSMFLLRRRELRPAAGWIWLVAVWGAVVLFWVVLAPRVFALGVRIVAVVRDLSPDDFDDLQRLASRVMDVTPDGLSLALLAPFRWLIAPALAEDWGSFLLSLAAPLVLLALLHEAIVRSRARFEEASLRQARVEASKKAETHKLERLSTRRRRRNVFRLPPRGRPEVAVLWKNLHQVARAPLVGAGLLVLGAIALTAGVAAIAGAPMWIFGVMAGVGAPGAAMAPLFVTLGVRNDMRVELRHLEQVRTWPVPARRLVLAEVLSSALVSVVFAVLGSALVAAGYYGARLHAALHGGRSDVAVFSADGAQALGMTPALVLPFLMAGLLPLAGGVAVLFSSLQNLATLMFPAWVGLGRRAPRGMAVMGQQLLLAVALGLLLMAGLIPGALLLGIALLAQWLIDIPWHGVELPLWGALASAPLYVEAWLLVRVGAARWERLDPSSEVLEVAS